MRGGLILESPRFKNFSHEVVFGSSSFLEEIKPLDRDISGIPVCYQGEENSCVSCTVTWIRQWLDKNKPDLSWEWLADISHTGKNGATPNQVLEPARKHGILKQESWDSHLPDIDFQEAIIQANEFKIPGYLYVRDLSRNGLYHALKTSPLAIGVRDWEGVGPHSMAAYDVTDDGQALKCKNWWTKDEQGEAIVPFDVPVIAVSFSALPIGLDKTVARLPFFDVLMDKLQFFISKYVTK